MLLMMLTPLIFAVVSLPAFHAAMPFHCHYYAIATLMASLVRQMPLPLLALFCRYHISFFRCLPHTPPLFFAAAAADAATPPLRF